MTGSQPVRAAGTAAKVTRGWDNAKRVNGHTRHLAVDTTGLLPGVVITAASVQDRDAAWPPLRNLHRGCRHIRLVWADAVYTGSRPARWTATLKMTLCIVGKRDPHAFEVLPRRWVVKPPSPDQQTLPHPRLRTPTRQPRSNDVVGRDRPDDPPPGPASPFIKYSLGDCP